MAIIVTKVDFAPIETLKNKCYGCGKFTSKDVELIDGFYFCNNCIRVHFKKCHNPECNTKVSGGFGWSVAVRQMNRVTYERYCNKCYNKFSFNCGNCGGRYDNSVKSITTNIASGVTVPKNTCISCFNSNFRLCIQCNCFHEVNKTYHFKGNYYCADCGNDKFGICSGCNGRFEFDVLQTYRAKKYCCVCGGFENQVQGSSYIPRQLRFHGKIEDNQALTLGMELEAKDNGCSHNEAFDLFRKHTGRLFYFKSDSSIGGGVEYVTHPFTFNWITSHKDGLRETLDGLKQYGWTSYDAGTCGIHIHMNKASFTTPHLLKFLEFFYYHQNYILRISQRGKYMGNYCTLSDYDSDGGLTYKAETKGGTQKYTAVNLSKSKTIEVRIFRGNLHFPSVMKNIEFCVAVFDYTKQATLKRVSMTGFNKYVKRRAKVFPNLWNFIIDKDLLDDKYTKLSKSITVTSSK